MDQIKIGSFIQELRKENGPTQEQFAEQFNVARRIKGNRIKGSRV